MGPVSSKEQDQPKPQIQINHPKFKNARFPQQRDQIVIALPYMHVNQINRWKEKFTPLLKHQCLLLPSSYQIKNSGYCGTDGLCKITYQNYPYNLKEEIQKRVTNGLANLVNEELWYTLFTILESASVFHQAGIKVGDIRPLNIFISDNGQVKVGNQYSFPADSTNYEKSLLDKETTYVAPQELKHLFFKSQSNENFAVAQSFSIGLTMLDAATLSNSQDIYNLNNCRLNYDKLNDRKRKLQERQNIDLIIKQIIHGLTEINHEERLHCDEIFKCLSNFKEQIINFQPFEIVDWPWMSGQRLKNRNDVAKTDTNLLPPIPQQNSGLPNFAPQNIKPQQIHQHNNVGLIVFPSQNIKPRQIETPQQNTTGLPSFQGQNNRGQQIPYQTAGHLLPGPEISNTIKIHHHQKIHHYQPPVYHELQHPIYPESLKQPQANYRSNNYVNPKLPNTNIGQISSIRAPAADEFRFTLSKIDEQLAKSREMFPS